MTTTTSASPEAPTGADAAPPTAARRLVAALPFGSLTTARTLGPLVLAIVALSIYTYTVNPAFLSSNNIQNILTQSAVLGILVVGQIILLVAGQIDLSVGSVVSFVGVMSAAQLTQGWSTPLVVVAMVVTGCAVGVGYGLLVTRFGIPPFILTLGGLSILGSLALARSDNQPIQASGELQWLGFGELFGIRAPVVVLLVVAIAFGIVLHYTRFGRNVYAIGSSRETAYLAGVSVNRIIVTIFAINGGLAALAGLVMMARLSAGDPRSGLGLELTVVAAAVLGGASLSGGRGTVIGALLGVLVFGVINASLTFLGVAGAYQQLVSGAILVIAVIATAIADRRAERGRRKQ